MINRVVLQGRLTADIELKQTQSGVSCVAFTVAWSEKYKEAETKCFLRCKAWRHTAEFLSKYFSKGQELVVEGKLNTEEWQTDDGNKRSATVLTVESAHFCGLKSQAQSDKPASEEYTPVTSEDDLPF